MASPDFESFFQGRARQFLVRAVDLALDEDGPDRTSQALFGPDETLTASVRCKAPTVAAALPLAGVVLDRADPGGNWAAECLVPEGEVLSPGTGMLRLCGPAASLLKAERVILNFLARACGVAGLTREYAAALAGTRTRLLDTRKTAPGLRGLDKYAVTCGGGCNHRMDLAEMLMLKDTHIDRAGSITRAVELLRAAHDPCPPLVVECRTLEEVAETAALAPERIMCDNMDQETLARALRMIPETIETEVSGGVDLDGIGRLAALGPDFISVGRITHSAPAADLSMTIISP
jgi:nicotinate-nucleotide pyrophosphorylase (carboxylating)